MVRFFVAAAPDLADAPRILRSSLFRASIRSLIAAARLSWFTVRSCKFMGIFINIRSWWKSSPAQRLLPATTSLIFAQVMTLKQPDSLSEIPFPFRNSHLYPNERLIPASQQRPSGLPPNEARTNSIGIQSTGAPFFLNSSVRVP